MGFPCGSAGKESAYIARDLGLIRGLGRSPGEGNSYPLQYSGLENSMNCIVHGDHKELDRTERLSLSLTWPRGAVHFSASVQSPSYAPYWQSLTGSHQALGNGLCRSQPQHYRVQACMHLQRMHLKLIDYCPVASTCSSLWTKSSLWW